MYMYNEVKVLRVKDSNCCRFQLSLPGMHPELTNGTRYRCKNGSIKLFGLSTYLFLQIYIKGYGKLLKCCGLYPNISLRKEQIA